MKIEKARAVKLMVALGLKNADKWNDQRMSAKLAKVNEMVDEDVTLEADEAETLKQVRATIEKGEGFEVVEAAAASEEAPTQVEKQSETESEPVVENQSELTPTKTKKAKKAKGPKLAKETKAFLAGQTVAKVGGLGKFKRDDIVRMYGEGYSKAIVDITYYRTVGGLKGFLGVEEKKPGRLYLAGQLLKNGAEITDELVKKLNELYGRPNDKESQTALNHTKEVIRGFKSVVAA